MSLWRRIVRLLKQSRIRLPRSSMDASELRPGDWVQLHSETWRVTSRRSDRGRVSFGLRRIDADGGAILASPRRGESQWTLELDGSIVDVPAELLVVFPVV